MSTYNLANPLRGNSVIAQLINGKGLEIGVVTIRGACRVFVHLFLIRVEHSAGGRVKMEKQGIQHRVHRLMREKKKTIEEVWC